MQYIYVLFRETWIIIVEQFMKIFSVILLMH